MKYVIPLFNLLFLSFLVLFSSPIHASEVKPYQITEAKEFIGTPYLPSIIWYTRVYVPWQSGRVVIAGNPDGTGNVDVGFQFEVYGSDTSKKFIYNAGCGETPMPPLDITHLMGPRYSSIGGNTELLIRYNRLFCNNWRNIDGVTKAYMDISPAYVVHFDDSSEKVTPFLELPWDYGSQGKSFNQASLSVSSWFDHAYPLLSTALSEPIEENDRIMDYKGQIVKLPYSSHDGYDWARKSGVVLGTPVTASGAGIATFKNYGACGNMIMIDHENGFQTRYCHLDDEGLVTTGEPISVTDGQIIGKVGMTGHTTGPHIHFMVVQDKNNDGNFEDNIPDGILDPFGWQSNSPDPWEKYTFSYRNADRTGNKSHYLWKTAPVKKTITLSSQGARVNVGGTTISIPQNTVSKDTILEITELPPLEEPTTDQVIEGVLSSASNRMKVVIHDGFGNVMTQFSQFLNLTIPFFKDQAVRLDPTSLSLYSSTDGSVWKKETSTVDLETSTVTAQVNHLTEFAIFGTPLDSVPPETNAELNGLMLDEYYLENAILTLSALDTPQETSLGIEHTLYRVNEGEMKVYENPIEVSSPGTYTVEYYSVDRDGNSEEMQTILVTIIPQPTPTPTFMPTPTPTPTPTSTPTMTPTPTLTSTPTPTLSPTHTPTPQKKPSQVLGQQIKSVIQQAHDQGKKAHSLVSIIHYLISQWLKK